MGHLLQVEGTPRPAAEAGGPVAAETENGGGHRAGGTARGPHSGGAFGRLCGCGRAPATTDDAAPAAAAAATADHSRPSSSGQSLASNSSPSLPGGGRVRCLPNAATLDFLTIKSSGIIRDPDACGRAAIPMR